MKKAAMDMGSRAFVLDGALRGAFRRWDEDALFMGVPQLREYEDVIRIVLGLKDSDDKLTPDAEYRRLTELHVLEKGKVTAYAGALLDWIEKEATGSGMENLRMRLEPDDLRKLTALWKRDEEESDSGFPTFHMYSLQEIRESNV